MADDVTVADPIGTMALAYLRLKTALSLYQQAPDALAEPARHRVERIAQRQYAIETRVLQSSEARGVLVPEVTVHAAFNEIRQRYANADEFEHDLERNGINGDGLREALVRELRVEAVLDKVASASARINPIDVELYYELHRDKFRRPEVRRARHILVTVNEALAENSRAPAQQRIDRIAQRLERDPRRFEEQALKHSECPTALQGGLLGDLPRGHLFPSLDAALFELKSGALSAVVESSLGFHILRCDAVLTGAVLPLSEVREKIHAHLDQRRKRMCQKNWLTQLGAADLAQ